MTIQSTTRKTARLPGNGATTSFPFTFKVQDTDDIVVYSVEDDVEAVVATADYTVTLNSDQNTNPGGSVVMDTAPASGVSLLITTGADATQEQNIQNQGSFNPTIVMEALDKLTILVQQLQEKASRSLTMPITDGLSGVLPGITDRASKFAAYDADGGPIASSGTPTDSVAVSAFMEAVLGSASRLAFAQNTGARIVFYPEDYEAVADGATTKTDNATALIAALAAAKTFANACVWIGNGKDYGFGRRLDLDSYNGFDGDGTGTLRMLNSSGKFDNTNNSGGTRYGTNAVGVYATGKTMPFVRGVKFIIDNPTAGQFIRPLYVTGCTDPDISGNEVTGFTDTELLTFSNCTRPKFWSNWIHDCHNSYVPVRRQLSGIAADNDAAASTDISIAFNVIENLTCSAGVIAAHGYESDGVNIIKNTTTGWIFGNTIRNAGECIDTFGPVWIFGNTLDLGYNYGVKLVHGPHGCRVFYNHINDAGIAHIVLAGSSVATTDTKNNIIEFNRCDGLDPNGVWAASDTACILFAANGGTTYLPRNNIVRNNHLNATGGQYGVLGPSGSGSGNQIYDNDVIGAATAPYNVHPTVGTVNHRARKFTGLTLSNGTDATNDIDIALGSVTDSHGAELLHLGATLTKRLDAAWAVGTGNGGLDTGSIADTTYHVWLIMRSDTRVTDALFSTSASAPTMPTGYDFKAYLGSVIRDSGAIVGVTRRGDDVLLKTPEVMYNTANPGTAAVLVTTRAPAGIVVDAIVSVSVRDTTVGADTGLLVTSPDQTDTAPNANLCDLVILNSSGTVGSDSGRFRIRTNTAREIRFRLSASTADHTVVVVSHGWAEPLGRET